MAEAEQQPFTTDGFADIAKAKLHAWLLDALPCAMDDAGGTSLGEMQH